MLGSLDETSTETKGRRWWQWGVVMGCWEAQ